MVASAPQPFLVHPRGFVRVARLAQFEGGITRLDGASAVLTAHGGNGAIRLAIADVRQPGAVAGVHVRPDAVVTGVEEPHTADVSHRPRQGDVAAVCPGGITLCIGGLLICAESFRVLGPCRGAWGATRVFTP